MEPRTPYPLDEQRVDEYLDDKRVLGVRPASVYVPPSPTSHSDLHSHSDSNIRDCPPTPVSKPYPTPHTSPIHRNSRLDPPLVPPVPSVILLATPPLTASPTPAPSPSPITPPTSAALPPPTTCSPIATPIIPHTPPYPHLDLDLNDDSSDIQYDPLLQPALIKHEIVSSPSSRSTIARARFESSRIISGLDDRVLVIIGPCSIHNPEQALEYARRLKEKMAEWPNLLIIMRSYL